MSSLWGGVAASHVSHLSACPCYHHSITQCLIVSRVYIHSPPAAACMSHVLPCAAGPPLPSCRLHCVHVLLSCSYLSLPPSACFLLLPLLALCPAVLPVLLIASVFCFCCSFLPIHGRRSICRQLHLLYGLCVASVQSIIPPEIILAADTPRLFCGPSAAL